MPYTIPPDNRAVGTGNPPQDVNNLADVLTGLGAGYSVLNTAFAGGADPSGSADSTAAIQAAENAAVAAGYPVLFPPGTYKVTGLVKGAGTLWLGAGRNETQIRLANGANADVIQGASFTTLTLTGSIAGIAGWGIRDMTIDGNKSNQSGTSYGLRVYGTDFDLYNVTIRNCLTDGMYSEWSNFAGFPAGADQSMEARLYGVKIYNSGGNGWHNRGPHDTRVWETSIYDNGGINYWGEGSGVATVAAGSNGVAVSTFAGAGVLNASTTLNFPAVSISSTQGSITVTTSGTPAVITYTGVTATTFTGCTTISGTGTVATGAAVTPTGTNTYTSGGTLLFGMHTYGASSTWGYVLDTATHLNGCIAEVSATGMVLVRSLFCEIAGGHLVVFGTPTGCGLQIGDAANPCGQLRADCIITGLAGTSAGTAAINVVNDGNGNAVDALVYQLTGGPAIYGTTALDSRYRVHAAGQSQNPNTGNSFVQDQGIFKYWLPFNNSASLRMAPVGGNPIINVNTGGASASRLEHNMGLLDRWYSDNFTTITASVDGATGDVVASAATVGQGWQPGDATLLAWAYDIAGATSSTAPTAGQVQLIRVNLRVAKTITNVILAIAAGGTSLTSAKNFAGLYNSSGTLIAATADQATPWASAGFYPMALSGGPYALASGFYWVAILANTTGTTPAFLRSANQLAASVNLGLTAANSRYATSGSALNTLPASFTPSAVTATGVAWWAGLS